MTKSEKNSDRTLKGAVLFVLIGVAFLLTKLFMTADVWQTW